MEDASTASVLLNLADYLIIGVIALSVLISLIRGFVKEAFSLLAWGAALWLAAKYCAKLATLFADKIETPSLRLVIAFGLLFLAVLIVGMFISYLLSQMVQKTGLSGTDRLLGVIFGLSRGVLVIAVVIMAASFTHLPQQPAWESSLLIPHFQVMADWLHHFLPRSIA